MAETILDVVIRVSVESGNMKLGPIDATDAMETLRSQLASTVGSFSDDSKKSPIPTSSSILQMNKDELGSPLGGKFGEMVGRPTSGSSSSATSGMKRANLDHEQQDAAQTTDEKEQKKKPKKHESAKEDLNSAKSDVEQNSASAVRSSMEIAKGAASIVTSNDEEAQSFVRVVVAIQGYYDVASGIVGLVKSLAVAQELATAVTTAEAAVVATSATVKGTAAVATGGLAAAEVGAAASATVLGTASAAACVPVGLLAAAAGVLLAPVTAVVLAVTAVVGALALWRLASNEHRQALVANYDLIIEKAKAASEATAKYSQNSSEFMRKQVDHIGGPLQDLKESRQILPNIKRREETEAKARAIEARTDLTPDQKATTRTRLEQRDQFTETFSAQKDKAETLRQQLSQLDADKVATHKNRQHILDRHKATSKSLEEKENAIVAGKTSARNPVSTAFLGMQFAYQFATGGKVPIRRTAALTVEAEHQLNKVHVDKQSEEVSLSKDLSANASAAESIDAKRVEINKQLLQVLAAQNKTVKEYQQETHRNVQTEKEKEKSFHQKIGSLDYGTLNQKKMMQDMHERIVAKKKENIAAGKDEWEGVEQMTPEMMSIIGDDEAAADSRDAQTNRDGEKRGIGRRASHKVALKDAEAEQARADELAAKASPKIQDEIGEKTKDSSKMADELGNKMKETFDLQQFTTTVIKMLDEIKADVNKEMTKLNSWTGG